MKAVKCLSLILAAAMLLSVVLVSCGKTGGDTDDENTIVQTTTEDLSRKYDAEIKNLHGHEFCFYSRESSRLHLAAHEIYAEQPTGEKINDAVLARNAQLADKYNCSITEVRCINIGTDTREPLQAGEYIADFLFGTAENMRPLAAANLLADYKLLSNINLQKAWWDQRALNGVNVGGKVFFITGNSTSKLPGSDVNYDTLISNYTSKVQAARKALQNYIKYINTEEF